MKPFIHAQSSVKQFGGSVDDYLKIHDWFDQTKAHFGDNRHRAILHSSFGIFLAEQVFGHTLTNSEGKLVSVRDIGEQHVVEDLECIPNIADYLSEMMYQDWMHGDGLPPSQRNLERQASLEAVGKLATSIVKGIDAKSANQIVDGSGLRMPSRHEYIDGGAGPAGGCNLPPVKSDDKSGDDIFPHLPGPIFVPTKKKSPKHYD